MWIISMSISWVWYWPTVMQDVNAGAGWVQEVSGYISLQFHVYLWLFQNKHLKSLNNKGFSCPTGRAFGLKDRALLFSWDWKGKLCKQSAQQPKFHCTQCHLYMPYKWRESSCASQKLICTDTWMTGSIFPLTIALGRLVLILPYHAGKSLSSPEESLRSWLCVMGWVKAPKDIGS